MVEIFKELLQQFRGATPKCDSWLSVVPRKEPPKLRCSCETLNLNLKEKRSWRVFSTRRDASQLDDDDRRANASA